MWESLQSCPEHPGRSGRDSGDFTARCRQALAELLQITDPCRIVLTQNATAALNLAIAGLGHRLQRILTSVLEHNSVLRPLRHLSHRSGARLDILPIDGQGMISLEHYDRFLDPKPDLVVLSHASNVTGRIQEIGQLFRKAHQAGAITLLDASQTIGQIPVHAEELEADMVAFSGHKYLLGPAGTGALYVAPGIELEPLLVGGTGIRSDLEFQPEEMPLRLEAGTPNIHGIAGLAAALQWGEKNRQQHIERGREVFSLLCAELPTIPGLEPVGSGPSECCLGILSTRLTRWTPEEAGYVLRESFGIVCRTGLHCAPLMAKAIGCYPEGTIRFSVSGQNSEKEVEALLEALRKMQR